MTTLKTENAEITPKDIVQKVSAEIGRIVALPDFRDKLQNSGMNTLPATSEELGQLMKKDFARYKHIIQTANMKIK